MASKVDRATWRMRQLCEVLNVGYSQPNRWHLWDGGAGDCSSCTYDSLWYGEILKRPANVYDRLWYTGTIPDDLTRAGFTRKAPRGVPRYGTVLWRPGHVAMCIDHDGNIDEAYASESYGIHGVDGDQTGWETRRARWDYPSAAKWWTDYFVPPESAYEEPKPKPVPVPKRQPGEGVDMAIRYGEVHRLANPNSGDHLYTADTNEVSSLVRAGWKDEGAIGRTPMDVVPVYGMYNADTGEHICTADLNEATNLLKSGSNLSDGSRHGWQCEGVKYLAYRGSDGPVKLHRMYARGGFHHLTADENEVATLKAKGWVDEGIKFSLDPK